jgi:Tfp pilus assembly protein PilP
MKKYIYILAAVLTLAACGQSQEEIETEKFEKEQQRKMDEIQAMRKRNKEKYENSNYGDSNTYEVYNK